MLRVVTQSFPWTLPSLTQSKQKQNWSDANVSACASASVESSEAAHAWACAKRSALPACQCRFRWWSASNCPLIPIPFPPHSPHTKPTRFIHLFFFLCSVFLISISFCSFFGFVLIVILLIVVAVVVARLWLRYCLGRFVLVRYLCWQRRRRRRQRNNGDYSNTCYMHVRYQSEREMKSKSRRVAAVHLSSPIEPSLEQLTGNFVKGRNT